jgi:GNAT superfamily N-acetyltransferase
MCIAVGRRRMLDTCGDCRSIDGTIPGHGVGFVDEPDYRLKTRRVDLVHAPHDRFRHRAAVHADPRSVSDCLDAALLSPETAAIPREDSRSPAGTALHNGGMTPRIRDATAGDWPAIWPIVREVVVAADTFAYDPGMTEDEGRTLWMVASPGRTTVAVGGATVLGTANMYANRAGPGAHVASASFMVASAARGRGVGRALVEDALSWARAAGFRAMQFNAVTDTNAAAVALYRSLGFSIVGTVPEAFDHPEHGLVALHIMHLKLR